MKRLHRMLSLVLALAVVATALFGTVGTAGAITFPDQAYQSVWDKTDKPVAEGKSSRTWMWGPNVVDIKSEQYAEAPGGQRQVVYMDKSRMEITNPSGDRNSQWFVTNGLLVKELITGQEQVGDNQFLDRWPSIQTVAGDPFNVNLDAPNYATFRNVANVNGDKRSADRSGQAVTERIDKAGNVTSDAALNGMATYASYNQDLGHNIANVFVDWFNQTGTVYQDGKFVQGQVVDWVFATGFPLTEPYWANVKVGGVDKLVLMQVFQRRVLTYTPSNPAGWQVEMGNVGQHYNFWRYVEQPPTPPPPPPPTAGVTITPAAAKAETQFIIVASGFKEDDLVAVGFKSPDGDVYVGTRPYHPDANGQIEIKIVPAYQFPTVPAGKWQVMFAAIGRDFDVTGTFTILPTQ